MDFEIPHNYNVDNQILEAQIRAESYANSLHEAREREARVLSVLEEERRRWSQSFEQKSLQIEQLERELTTAVEALHHPTINNVVHSNHFNQRPSDPHIIMEAEGNRSWERCHESKLQHDLDNSISLIKSNVRSKPSATMTSAMSVPIFPTPPVSHQTVNQQSYFDQQSHTVWNDLLNQYKHQLSHTKQELDLAIQEKSKLQDVVKTMETKVLAVHDECQQLKQVREDLQSKLQFRANQILEYEEDRVKLMQANQEYEQQFSNLQQALHNSQLEAKRNAEEKLQMQQQIQGLQQGLILLRSNDMSEDLKRKLIHKEAQITNLTERLEETESRYSQQLVEMKRNVHSLQVRLKAEQRLGFESLDSSLDMSNQRVVSMPSTPMYGTPVHAEKISLQPLTKPMEQEKAPDRTPCHEPGPPPVPAEEEKVPVTSHINSSRKEPSAHSPHHSYSVQSPQHAMSPTPIIIPAQSTPLPAKSPTRSKNSESSTSHSTVSATPRPVDHVTIPAESGKQMVRPITVSQPPPLHSQPPSPEITSRALHVNPAVPIAGPTNPNHVPLYGQIHTQLPPHPLPHPITSFYPPAIPGYAPNYYPSAYSIPVPIPLSSIPNYQMPTPSSQPAVTGHRIDLDKKIPSTPRSNKLNVYLDSPKVASVDTPSTSSKGSYLSSGMNHQDHQDVVRRRTKNSSRKRLSSLSNDSGDPSISKHNKELIVQQSPPRTRSSSLSLASKSIATKHLSSSDKKTQKASYYPMMPIVVKKPEKKGKGEEREGKLNGNLGSSRDRYKEHEWSQKNRKMIGTRPPLARSHSNQQIHSTASDSTTNLKRQYSRDHREEQTFSLHENKSLRRSHSNKDVLQERETKPMMRKKYSFEVVMPSSNGMASPKDILPKAMRSKTSGHSMDGQEHASLLLDSLSETHSPVSKASSRSKLTPKPSDRKKAPSSAKVSTRILSHTASSGRKVNRSL